MIRVDFTQLKAVERGLSRYEDIMPRSVRTTALRKSVRPLLLTARDEVPVGKNSYERISLKHRTSAYANDYRRGGATRRDLRIRIVKGEGDEFGRALIGVSKKKGIVGWRTRFISRGTIYTRKNDFIKRTYEKSGQTAIGNFEGEVLTSFRRWANKNLPKGRI